MKNNDGKGLYEIGEKISLACGCVIVARVIGYTHYIHPSCQRDNRPHSLLKGYEYKRLEV